MRTKEKKLSGSVSEMERRRSIFVLTFDSCEMRWGTRFYLVRAMDEYESLLLWKKYILSVSSNDASYTYRDKCETTYPEIRKLPQDRNCFGLWTIQYSVIQMRSRDSLRLGNRSTSHSWSKNPSPEKDDGFLRIRVYERLWDTSRTLFRTCFSPMPTRSPTSNERATK